MNNKISDLYDIACKQRNWKVALFLEQWVCKALKYSNEQTIEEYLQNSGGIKPKPRLKGNELIAKEPPWKYATMKCPTIGWSAIKKIESFLISNGVKTHA